ncbi:hypothetical protein VZT92_009608 [Zoarces viviparus]|uniref:Non-selective voltage-gated ion channel VDAC3 n=1 Tax=Zoarces viviparus TaxID=48416 RepID=A0AAW1FCA0_ZOAVI
MELMGSDLKLCTRVTTFEPHQSCNCFADKTHEELWREKLTKSKKSGKLKTAYKRDFVNLGCDVDFEGPIIHAAAVLGYEGWIAGYQMAFDTAKSKLAKNNFALGYKAGDFQLHTNV